MRAYLRISWWKVLKNGLVAGLLCALLLSAMIWFFAPQSSSPLAMVQALAPWFVGLFLAASLVIEWFLVFLQPSNPSGINSSTP